MTEELEGFWRGWTDKWELGGTGATSGIERVLDGARASSVPPLVVSDSSRLQPHLVAPFSLRTSLPNCFL